MSDFPLLPETIDTSLVSSAPDATLAQAIQTEASTGGDFPPLPEELDLSKIGEPAIDPVRSNLAAFSDVDSAHAARANKVSRENDLPFDVVFSDPVAIEKEVFAGRIANTMFHDSTSGLVEYLSKPQNTMAAKRDLPTLVKLADSIRGSAKNISTAYNVGDMQVELGDLHTRKLNAEVFGFTPLTPEQESRLRYLETKIAISPYDKNMLTWAANTAPMMGRTVFQGVQGAMLGAAAGSLAGPIGAAAGARAGFGIAAINRVREIETGNAIAEFRGIEDDAGNKLSPEVVAAAAYTYGALSAGLETVGMVFQGAPAVSAGKTLLKERVRRTLATESGRQMFIDLAKRYAMGVTAEGATEAAQQFIQVAAREFAKYGDSEAFTDQDLTKTIENIAATAPGEMADAAIQGAGAAAVFAGFGTTFHAGVQYQRRVELSKNDPVKFTELVQAAREIELIQHDPDGAKEAIQSIDPSAYVYVDTVQTAMLMQEKTEQEIAQDKVLTLLKSYLDEAKATGEDIQMPLAEFMVEVATTSHADDLMPLMKLDPNGVAPIRAEQEKQNFYAMVRQNLEESKLQSEITEEGQQVFDEVRQQLMDAGVAPGFASVNAEAVKAWVQQTSERTGMPVKDVWAKAGLKIEGPLTEKRTLVQRAAGVLNQVIGRPAARMTAAEGAATPSVEGMTQDGPGTPRGYYDPQQTVIRLTEASNSSTFLHEFAHFMLDMERRLGGDQVEAINEWFLRNSKALAIEAGTTEEQVIAFVVDQTSGDIEADAKINVAAHEQFARGYEAYMMEGVAPSDGMRRVFRAISRWMRQVYESVAKLNVNLDDEMRQVFARFFAADEEIEAAAIRTEVRPMFTDAVMAGMTEEQFQKYKERVNIPPKDKAKESLRKKLIKQFRRSMTEEWNTEKEAVKEAEIAKLMREPVYMVKAYLEENQTKLNYVAVMGIIGDYKDKAKLTKMVSKKSEPGVHPDLVAGNFGFGSGAEMVVALATASSMESVANQRAEAHMIEVHGDILHDGSIEAEADAALANEEYTDMLHEETKVLSRKIGRKTLERRAMQEQAQRKIDSMTYSAIKPDVYHRAEVRAAAAAAKVYAEGKTEEALIFKQQQLMSHLLWKEALRARRDAEKVRDFMARFRKTKLQAQIIKAGSGYWEQIEAMMLKFDFRKRPTGVDKINMDFTAWVNERMGEGDPLDIDPTVLSMVDSPQVYSWKDVPVGTLIGVQQAAKNIETVAKNSNKLTVAGESLEYEAAVEKAVQVIRTNAIEDFKHYPTSKVSWLATAIAQLSKVPWLIKWLDGEHVGYMYNLLYKGVKDSAYFEMDLLRQTVIDIERAILGRDHKTKMRHNQSHFIPEIVNADRTKGPDHDGNLYGHQIIAIALNTGNEQNLRKLLLGEGWAQSEEEVSIDNPKLQAVLGKLTKGDWELVQMIWDRMEMLYPMMEEVYKRNTGLTPARVEPSPVTTPFGTFRGGYYPLKPAKDRGVRAQQIAAKGEQAMEALFSGFQMVSASVGASSTKQRTGAVYPLSLSLDVVGNHFQEVIHYITHYDAVKQTVKLLNDPRIAQAIQDALGPADAAQFKPWITRIAKDGRMSQPKNVVDKTLTKFSNGYTIAVMAYNMGTMLAQPLGLAASMAEVGAGRVLKQVLKTVGPALAYKTVRNVFQSGKDYTAAQDFVFAMSKAMGHRAESMNREFLHAMQVLERKVGPLSNVQREGFRMIAFSQINFVDIPTWLSAYEKSLSESGDEAKSVEYADFVVEQIQGSGLKKDLSELMASESAMTRLLTMFQTFFSSQFNQLRDIARETRGAKYREMGVVDSTKFAVKQTERILLMMVLPVIAEMWLKGDLLDDDDEVNYEKMMLKTSLYLVQGVPFLNSIANGLLDEYGYNMSPVEQLVSGGVAFGKGVMSGDPTYGAAKAGAKVAAAATGVPFVQPVRSAEFLYNVIENDDEFTLRQLIYGKKR